MLSRLIPAASLLSIVVLLGGCQSTPQEARRSNPAADDRAVPASDRTPDGDRLSGPIPYGHWPYTIDRGGGGGAPR